MAAHKKVTWSQTCMCTWYLYLYWSCARVQVWSTCTCIWGLSTWIHLCMVPSTYRHSSLNRNQYCYVGISLVPCISTNKFCLILFNSLFTPPTWTRQDCLVAVWTQLQTRQDSFVLSRTSFQFPSFQWSSMHVYLRLNSCKLETGTTQNCLVLSPVVFIPQTRTRQDSFVLSVSAVWTGYYTSIMMHFLLSFLKFRDRYLWVIDT